MTAGLGSTRVMTGSVAGGTGVPAAVVIEEVVVDGGVVDVDVGVGVVDVDVGVVDVDVDVDVDVCVGVAGSTNISGAA